MSSLPTTTIQCWLWLPLAGWEQMLGILSKATLL